VRVLVADKFPDSAMAQLRSLGFSVDYKPALKRDTLPVAIGGVHVLVVRSTEVDADAIAKADALSLVVRAGAGTNTIDKKACSDRGIYVSNCPGRNAVAVAELAMGLVLALDRRIPDNVADLRAGRWNKKEYSKAAGLMGRTLGIAGLGRIGQEVLARARAFGLLVEGWSRSLGRARAASLDVGYNATLEELAEKVDILTVHLALAADTRGIVSRGVFEALPRGAIFVNTSRGEIVDEEALRDAVRTRGLRAGLDVFMGEPEAAEGEFKSETTSLPGVYGTHHIGASTEQAQAAIAEETIRVIRSFRDSGEVPNCVNLAARSPARCQLIVRHYDKVGVLAGVLGALHEANINVEEIENEIFEGARAACARIRLVDRPPEAVLAALRARREDILHLELLDL
jgi:D-3-phosphoglycerate dehydrogenase / 2-oxoglutarate reductase